MIADGPNSPAERLGFRFVSAALEAGQQINKVFFFHDAVTILNHPLASEWERLTESVSCELQACVAASERRQTPAPPPGWAFASLASWWDDVLHADRVVRFGPQITGTSENG